MTRDINPIDPASLRDGGILNLPIPAIPLNFNPLHVEASPDYIKIAQASYPRTFVVGPDGSLTADTDYFIKAESYNHLPPAGRDLHHQSQGGVV